MAENYIHVLPFILDRDLVFVIGAPYSVTAHIRAGAGGGHRPLAQREAWV